MDQRRLHWSLPPCGKDFIPSERATAATRQGSSRRSFTDSRESRVQKRAGLQIRLEFLRAHVSANKANNL